MKKRLLSVVLALTLCLGLAVPAMAAEDTFADVSADHWAYEAVERMASLKVVGGIGDGMFAPGNKVSCADFSTMVARLLFHVDLDWHGSDSPWWKAGADVLLAAGALDGTAAKASYSTENGWDAAGVVAPMSRYDMAQIMYNTLKAKGCKMPSESELDAAKSEIADYADIPSEYTSAVTAMYALKCLSGIDGSFCGSEQMTRAQACTVLMRMLGKYDEVTPDLNIANQSPEVTIKAGDMSAIVSNLPKDCWFEVESSDPAVASVSADGVVTGEAPGKATITVTLHLGGKSQTIEMAITVTEAE